MRLELHPAELLHLRAEGWKLMVPLLQTPRKNWRRGPERPLQERQEEMLRCLCAQPACMLTADPAEELEEGDRSAVAHVI